MILLPVSIAVHVGSRWHVSIAVRVLYACTPLAAIPQWWHLKRSGKEGFASGSCLALLLSSVMRVAFWIGRHVKDAPFLTYSLLTAMMQLLLLDAVLSVKRKKQASGLVFNGGKRSAYSRPQIRSEQQFGQIMRKLVHAAVAGDVASAGDLAQAARASFWAWDELAPYVEVVVVFSLVVAASTALFMRSVLFTRAMGVCAALAEALVGLPQVRMNWRRRDSTGLSTGMTLAWLAGDVVKYSYYAMREGQTDFFSSLARRSTVFQIAVDFVTLSQICVYSAAARTANKRCLTDCAGAGGADSQSESAAEAEAAHALLADAVDAASHADRRPVSLKQRAAAACGQALTALTQRLRAQLPCGFLRPRPPKRYVAVPRTAPDSLATHAVAQEHTDLQLVEPLGSEPPV